MVIKITPAKLDGVHYSDGSDDEIYYIAANAFGNRVRVDAADKARAGEIKNLLLAFNAKGTAFDLTERGDLVPIISFCACYAFSDTLIKVADNDLANRIANAINGLGGKAEFCRDTLKVCGKAGLNGGSVDAGNNVSVAKAAIFAATCADSDVTVSCDADLGERFFKTFRSLGGQIEVL